MAERPLHALLGGTRLSRTFRSNAGLVLLALVFLAMVCFVNPLREMLSSDDAFSYARSVRHLLEAGEYRPDPWAAANMPAQIYLAAGLAKVFGFSLGLLAVSTLLILAGGLMAFYALLRDFGASDGQATVFGLGLLSSPPVLLMGFSFMTDVQFMGWIILAAWLYARAIRRKSLGRMLLASVPAAAAIGTRQFGIALLGALFFTWLLLERQRLRAAPLYAVGTALPLLAALWQVRAGLAEPNFTQLVRLCEQSLYLRQGRALLGEILWRPTVMLEHAVLFLLPMLPVLAFLVWVSLRHPPGVDAAAARKDTRLNRRLLLASTVIVAAGLAYASVASEAVGGNVVRAPWMPATPWIVEHWGTSRYPILQIPLTVIAVAGAVVLGWLLSLRYLRGGFWRRVPAGEAFLALLGSALLLLHLAYVQLNDTYVIPLLPFILFVLAQLLQEQKGARWWIGAAGLSCGAAILLLSLVIRGTFERSEAVWALAERLRADGVQPLQVRALTQWNLYHSAFDDWVAQIGGTQGPGRYCGPYLMHGAFLAWFDEHQQGARYAVVTTAEQLPDRDGYGRAGIAAYRDALFRRRYAYVAALPRH